MVSAARPAAAGAMAVLPPAGAAAAGAPAATLPPIDVPAAQRHMEGHDHATRAAVLGVMAASPTFRLYPGESKEVERARTAARWAELADAGLFVDTIAAADAAAGRAKLDAIHETASLLDYSLCIGMSVHFSLFGGSIAALGTSAQAAAWLPGVEALTMRGCFALTELGHGSNARGVETEARFDAATDAFVLHTPTDAAQKYWIGGAATTARWAVAFAQLYMPGEATTRGVHAFVVRIREDDGTPVPGILLADCGYKVGLNGVDNGRIWFSHAPVPRGHLLARYARVDAAGVYTCDAPSPDALFGVTMSALSGGRIGIAASGVGQARVALAIALCYAIRRRAFAPTPTAPEVLLLDYPVHRRRLLPRLASTVVHQTALNDLKARWGRALSAKDGHVASCGFKSLMTWHALETMQVAREACGGQGYKSENRIGVSRAALDISATFEGDNTVLLQQVTKSCLASYASGVKAGGRWTGALEHLNHPPPLPPPIVSMDFAVYTLRRAEAALLPRLATAIAASTSQPGVTPFDAFTSHQVAADAVARVHTQLLLLAAYTSATGTGGGGSGGGGTVGVPPSLRPLLDTLGTLHGLATLDDNGVLLRTGALSPTDAAAVHDAVDGLCTALRPHAAELAAVMTVPDFLLAPIAFDVVAHNSRARL